MIPETETFDGTFPFAPHFSTASGFRMHYVGKGSEMDTGDDSAIVAIRSKPAMLIMGMQDQVLLPKYFIPLFEEAFPKGGVYRLENAGHFLYEDEPEVIALLIDQFVRLT
jgi:pimeloyl-ACP methyl ester carboxylesterase